MKKNSNEQSVDIALYNVIKSLLLILALDSLFIFVDGREGTAIREINWVVNALYLSLAPLATISWLIYVKKYIKYQVGEESTIKKFIVIPIVLLVVMCFASPWTKWVFYLDDRNIYHRGQFHFIHIVVTYFYLIISLINILIALKKVNDRHDSLKLLSLIMFFVLPSIGGIISIFAYGVPSIWPMASLSLMMIYSTHQNNQISTDSLTGLNNRRQFDRKLHAFSYQREADKRLYLFLFDVDKFKMINDTYGHFEGDCALKEVSAILKKICKNRNMFIARYGGDEFVAISCSQNQDEISEFGRELTDMIEERNKTTQKPYELAISLGCSSHRLDGQINTSELIKVADASLYRQKKNKYNGGR